MYNLLTNTLTQHPFSFTGIEVLILKAILLLSVFSIAPTIIKYTLIKKFTPVKTGKVKKEKPKYIYEMNYVEFKRAEVEFDRIQAKNEFYDYFCKWISTKEIDFSKVDRDTLLKQAKADLAREKENEIEIICSKQALSNNKEKTTLIN